MTVKIGWMTDATGVAASAMIPDTWSLVETINYMQQEEPIPGVEVKVESWDTQLNPARAIPGYEWLKERGAVTILGYIPQITEILAPFLEADKMPLFCATLSEPMQATPWIFGNGFPVAGQYTIPLKWTSDHWPNYPTKPKIGVVGWNTSYEIDVVAAVKDYCLAHSDKFEWVGDYLAPAGTMTWSSEVQKLKDCDWICVCHAGGAGQATFIADFSTRGYEAKFFSGEGMDCWTDLIVGKAGWEAVDGSLTGSGWPRWTDPYPIVDVAKELVQQHHPGDAERVMMNNPYVSNCAATVFVYELIKAAIEEVGVENLDGQAIYDTAINFQYTIEGMPEMGYTETSRVSVHYGKVYEWRADTENLMAVSDWVMAPE